MAVQFHGMFMEWKNFKKVWPAFENVDEEIAKIYKKLNSKMAF